ncbi:MAG: hypothetical protein Q9227_009078 [Pyrenula ochraceoflavens]
MIPLLTLEEHFTSDAFLTSPRNSAAFSQFPPHIRASLQNLSHSRIAALDAGSITKQVISHGAGTGNLSQCRAANDQLKAAIDEFPTRFAGFAVLPMSDPVAAADELRRCVNDLGFVGALIENHLADDLPSPSPSPSSSNEEKENTGIFFDAPRFRPLFSAAVDLDTVIYLHPTFPTPNMSETLYKGNYPTNPAQHWLGAAGFGWHALTALHFLRLYASGLFDAFPTLKLVLGHMGEMLPFQIERCFRMDNGGKGMYGTHTRDLRTVWRENLWVTTSGMFGLGPLRCSLEVLGKERVMYSVDYPFSGNEVGKGFVEEVERSGVFTREELEGFGYGNAARLLKLDGRGEVRDED